MSDLSYIDRTIEVKIAGQDATGLGVNYVGADANGNMLVKDYSNGPVTPGSAAAVSSLIGGQFNTTLPTLTNTQQSAVQANQFGEHTFQFRNKIKNIAGAATTVVKSGSGRLHGVQINNPSAGGVITVYDNTAASGTKLMTITSGFGSSAPAVFLGPLGAEFATGLTVVTTVASSDWTIYYY